MIRFSHMVNQLTNNLFVVANNIHQPAQFFKIVKDREGNELLTKANVFERLFVRSGHHKEKVQALINKNIDEISNLNKEALVVNDQPTELFLAVQKFQRALQTKGNIQKKRAIGKVLQFNTITSDKIKTLAPVSFVAVHDKGKLIDDDGPVIVKERRYFHNHNIKRYPCDHADHTAEAGKIFLSTQIERFLSMVGRVAEAVSSIFKKNVTGFRQYHYNSKGESEEKYSVPKYEEVSPITLSEEPTSYWLGHATLFLGVPVKSANSAATTKIHVITDPVEEDLNALFYPRQTKFARPMERMPAPDVYMLSHNHLDHYSKATVKKIFLQQPVMIVPKGDADRFRSVEAELGLSGTKIIEMDWWDQKELEFQKNGETFKMKITATPSRHWSGQGPCGGHESTFVGYVIHGEEDIYIAGDTARMNDDHVGKLREHFNIRWNYQPGGPDEVREQMETTHQSSADGLAMHAKIMLAKANRQGMSKEAFIAESSKLKTVYMHTMTYKLGNLHLSDTKDSLSKIIGKLRGEEAEEELKNYEQPVYQELVDFAKTLEFKDGKKISEKELGDLLHETVIIPKIGSRLDLAAPKSAQAGKTYY